MSTKILVDNFVETTLAAGINGAATSFQIASAISSLPALADANELFYLVLEEGATREIVKVAGPRNAGGDTFGGGGTNGVLTRGQDGTSAATFTTACKVRISPVKAIHNAYAQKDADETFNGQKTHVQPLIHTVRASLPSAPNSGFMAEFAMRFAGIPLPVLRDDGGWTEPDFIPMPSPLTHFFFHAFFRGGGKSQSGAINALLNLDSPTEAAVSSATGSIYAESTANRYTTGAAAANRAAAVVADGAGNTQPWHRSATAGRGGFLFYTRWGVETVDATGKNRLFVGLTTLRTTAYFTAEPRNAAADHIGIASDDDETAVQIFTKDGTTNTKTALTTARTKAQLSGKLYDLWIGCEPGATRFGVRFDELDSGSNYARATLYDGTINTTIPRTGQFILPLLGLGTGTATVSTQFRLSRVYAIWRA